MNFRLASFVVLMALWSVLLAARLIDVQIGRHDYFAHRARSQQQTVIEVAPERSSILDVRGRLMALSLVVDSAFADTHRFRSQDAGDTARQLARVLGVEAADLERKLATDRDFIFLARQLDPPIANRLRALDLPGIGFVEETRRYYPMGELAAQVLGFVGKEGHGLSGLEYLHDEKLAGKRVLRALLRDALRRQLLSPDSLTVTPERSLDLRLTLDAALQLIAEREVARAAGDAGATGGSVVLLDPRTGAVLALASYPGFDANNFGKFPQRRWVERNSAFSADAGPLLDLLATVAAAEAGEAQQERPTALPLPSASAVSPARLRALLRSLGFGARTGIDLPGESAGSPPDPMLQREPPRFVAPGFIATPLQIATAFAALVNGGRRIQPYLVATRDEDRPLLERVISRETSEALRLGGFEAWTAANARGAIAMRGRSFAPATTEGRVWRHLGFAPAGGPTILGLVTLEGAGPEGRAAAAAALEVILEETSRYLRLSPDPSPPATWPGQELIAGH